MKFDALMRSPCEDWTPISALTVNREKMRLRYKAMIGTLETAK